MKILHTPESLMAFEKDIADCFNAGKIRSPIHLESGSEKDLINLFKFVQEEDWVLCTWRSHLKCLLKGVPPERLKEEILKGKSIGLCFPEYKILSSAIVGGTCPIAVGLAMGIQKRGEKNGVVCFVGDMTAESGIFHECSKYANNHELPIWWIIEDNALSTNTPTAETWRSDGVSYTGRHIYHYRYTNGYPHQGTGKWVDF